MAERRYNDAEVAEIFRRATETPREGAPVPLASSGGMTLEALQEIGRDVGIGPEDIARAAQSLDRLGEPHTRSFLGLPLGVGRTVQLDRRLTDAEWDALVVDLRETFDARGRLRDEGSFRQWTNGNLQALLEPVGDTHRLRLRTLNGSAQIWMMGGAAMFGVAAVMAMSAVMGVPQDALTARIGSLALFGAGLFAVGALRLPHWARIRREQMAAVAERTLERARGLLGG